MESSPAVCVLWVSVCGGAEEEETKQKSRCVISLESKEGERNQHIIITLKILPNNG